MFLSHEAQPLLHLLTLHCTQPTSQRFEILLIGVLLITERLTVANLLDTLRHLTPYELPTRLVPRSRVWNPNRFCPGSI
jgi:hypothetical protein